MEQNPIHRVLSTIRKHEVRALLMGGQACIFYGAAEFSRDTDLVVVADSSNLERLARAMQDLDAQVIAVPPFAKEYLDRGHSVHFSCRRTDVRGMRVDVMSKMRGVDEFDALWARRTTAHLPGLGDLDLIALPDLVAAKKTQRDKDWPMLRRLLEANYFAGRDDPTWERIRFWLHELRTPELLIELVSNHPAEAAHFASARGAVALAIAADVTGLREELAAEEASEREADRAYWAPLRKELEALRHAERRKLPPETPA